MIKARLFFFLLFTVNFVFSQTYNGHFNSIGEIESVGEQIFFVANDGLYGDELWITDGSKRNTHLVKDIMPGSSGSSISSITSFNGNIYFKATDPINGAELWRSDGTNNGTYLLKNIRPNDDSRNNGSNVEFIAVTGGFLYFVASEDGIYTDVWKTDGTANGTVKIFEREFVGILDFTIVENSLFIVRRYGPNELWHIDLDSNESIKVEIDDHYYIGSLTPFNNNLIFITYSSNNRSIRLYNLDPSNNLFTLLDEFERPQYGSQDIDNFTVVGDQLFFSVRTDFQNDPETDVLWKTDGSPEGTIAVRSFSWDRHRSNSFMQNFIHYNDVLFFRGSSGVQNYLYQSDGTNDGTVLVKDIQVDEYVNPIVSNDKLYFASEDGRLWKSDGTPSNTMEEYSFLRLGTYTDPTLIHESNGVIYFKASDENKLALWNNVPNSKIEVELGRVRLSNNANLEFESKVDSMTTHSLTINNLGHKGLSISNISVTGNDFGLLGNIPFVIESGEFVSLDLLHLPYAEGHFKRLLTIASNDLTEPTIKVNLISHTNGVTSQPNLDSVVLVQKLVPMDVYDTIDLTLDNNRLLENNAAPNKIGELSVEGHENLSFSLVEGLGDRDNSLFDIQGNELIATESFDYESNNVLNVRVKGSNNSSEISLERPFLIEIENQNEDESFDDCEPSLSSLSYALLDVKFINDQTIIAIGENGVILKSYDAGMTWKQVNSGTKRILHNVQFVDGVGYIVGDYGLILKSENQGDDWYSLESPTQEFPYPNNLYFLNSETGFLFGDDGYIYKTINGGKTWSGQRQGWIDLLAADFINDSVGFISGKSNVLLKTNNLGESWTSVEIDGFGFNPQFVDIQFIDEYVGFLAGDDGEIIKTVDSGVTWSQVGSFPTNFATNILFLNENSGYATGGWSGSNIYKTEDGGVTWASLIETDFRNNPIALDLSPDFTKGCAVGYGSSLGSTGENGRTIFTMSNEEWSLNSTLQEADFISTSMINDSIIYVFGRSNFRSLDGGITWNKMDIGNDELIIESFFVDEKNGFVVDRTDVYRTTDGGISWTRLDDSAIDSRSFRNLYFLNADFGFAFGAEGIYRTTNAGTNWTKTLNGTSVNAIEDMFFLNSQVGFAVSGNPAEVLRTDDGGLTWTALNNYYLKWLRFIHFFDDENGIAVGNDGFQLKTSDGGNTWIEAPTGITSDFHSVYFLNSSVGYAAAGAIYKTENAGDSWSLVTQSSQIRDVAGFNSKMIFAGERGALVSINDGNEPTITAPITGPAYVSTNSLSNYEVPTSANTFYKWEVEGINHIDYFDNLSTLHWLNTGTFTITVVPYNSCGEGKSRTITVSVEDAPKPFILGNDSAIFNSEELYTSEIGANSRFHWTVDGSTDYRILNDSSISVQWMEETTGGIELVETSNKTGARGYDQLIVVIEEITLGTIEELFPEFKIYPNPTSDFLNFEFNEYNNYSTHLRILETSGRMVRALTFDDVTRNIDIRDLKTGVYFIQIENNGHVRTSRFVKLPK